MNWQAVQQLEPIQYTVYQNGLAPLIHYISMTEVVRTWLALATCTFLNMRQGK